MIPPLRSRAERCSQQFLQGDEALPELLSGASCLIKSGATGFLGKSV